MNDFSTILRQFEPIRVVSAKLDRIHVECRYKVTMNHLQAAALYQLFSC